MATRTTPSGWCGSPASGRATRGRSRRMTRRAAASGCRRIRFCFLCPQSLFKIHPDNDALFARVLAAAPGAQLVLFEGRHPALTAKYLARLDGALAREGLGARRARARAARNAVTTTTCGSIACATRCSTRSTGRAATRASTRSRADCRSSRCRDASCAAARARACCGSWAWTSSSRATSTTTSASRPGSRTMPPWRAALSTRIAAAHGRVFDDRAPVAAMAQFCAKRHSSGPLPPRRERGLPAPLARACVRVRRAAPPATPTRSLLRTRAHSGPCRTAASARPRRAARPRCPRAAPGPTRLRRRSSGTHRGRARSGLRSRLRPTGSPTRVPRSCDRRW